MSLNLSPRSRNIDWLWDKEDKFTYHPEYPLSRLLPNFDDLASFKEFFVVFRIDEELSFLEKFQLFLTWLTDSALGKTVSPVYYMGLIARLRSQDLVLIGGLPPLSLPKPDQKPSDFRRFCQR